MDKQLLLLIGAVLVIAALFAFGFAKAGVSTGNAQPMAGAGGINLTKIDVPNVSLPKVEIPNVNVSIPNVNISNLPLQNVDGGNMPESLPQPLGSNERIIDTYSTADVKMSAIDGVEVRGTIYQPLRGQMRGSILLLHSAGKDRGEYAQYASYLAARNWTVLAIDLRGHGQTHYKQGFASFTTEDWISAKRDIDAAIASLYERAGTGNDTHTHIIGASVGANLALQYGTDGRRSLDETILLSPGMDYRGVKIGGAAAKYSGGRMLAVASEGDAYSAQSARQLAAENPKIEAKIISGGAHGAEMLNDATTRNYVVAWLEK